MIFFVTGGSRGIGAGVVKELVAAGHSVAFTYAAQADLAEAVAAEALAGNDGAQCRAYALDVRDPEAVERVADEVLDAFGSVDVVVLNAAINRPGLVVSMSDEDWRDVIDVNLTGSFFVCRQFLPTFLANRRGRFIHISSLAMHGISGLASYAASKAALIGLSATLAKEYGRKGVTSNVLSLGFFDTDMSRELMPERQIRFWNEFCPVGRIGEIPEIAHAILYLASDAAGFMNGETLNLTGGVNWAP
jgi:NAD(P)-dependent dehydrogenase (short-subunit alcohol dehydrogenase family)